MAKASTGAAAPPKKKQGRESHRQVEIQEGLELLKQGTGERVKDERGKEWLVVDLDTEKVVDAKKAHDALMNLRWKLNPENKLTGGNEAEFKRLFVSAGRGGLKVYPSEDGKKIHLSAIAEYAEKKTATKGAAKTAAAKPRQRTRKPAASA